MAITRTPWIDDDGSGTTGTVINNAEKTLLYDQIDAALAPLPPSYAAGSWTPTDVSGAGLVFTTAKGNYVRIGTAVIVQGNVLFPVTASTAPVAIGGLPFAINPAVEGGLYITYGIHHIVVISTTIVHLAHPTSGLPRQNGDVSGAWCEFAGVYITT